MSKLILLYLTIILGMVFVILPNWDGTFMKPDPFYFYDFGDGNGIAYQTYVYMIAEYFISLIFVGIIANEATKFKGAIWIFFGLIVVDLFDFLLCYNSIWFHLSGLPVSMNIVKGLVFGLVIFKEWLKELR